jgi:hypothetical protein
VVKGAYSPMLEVEPYLVELIIKLAEMRTPITTSQGLQLANSLIKGTSVEEQVIKWKKKYLPTTMKLVEERIWQHQQFLKMLHHCCWRL